MSTPKPVVVLTHTIHHFHGHKKTIRPVFIWYFHSNAAILCLKSNKMRHHPNKECTKANRSKYERTQAVDSLDTYQTSLQGHKQTIRPVFIWYFHFNATILCLKSNKLRQHRNKECTTANRSKYNRTQAGGSLDTYETSLHVHMQTISPVFIWYFHSNATIL